MVKKLLLSSRGSDAIRGISIKKKISPRACGLVEMTQYFISFRFIFLVTCHLSLVTLVACQTAPKKTMSPKESQADMISAVEKITGAMASPGGEPIDAENLIKELKKDEEARSAMQSISEGVAPQRHIIRYCPETGDHFGPSVDVCPGTGTPLVEIIEEY